MKVIIYFGHHKVGSTALQSYFARNTLSLLQQGILYPAVEAEGLTNLLAVATGAKRELDLERMNVREPHNALAFRMLSGETGARTPPWHDPLPGLPAMEMALRHQISVFNPHTVILCSEVFANFGAGHVSLIERLKNLFAGAEIELFCTLRRPDDYQASWYGQRLRFGHKLGALWEPDGLDLTSIHYDYRKMIEPWLSVFPGAKFHLRNYSDTLKNGGSVEDFLLAVGLGRRQRTLANDPKNISLPRAAFSVVREANNTLSDREASEFRKTVLNIAPALNLPKSNEVEVFGAENRRILYENFAPIDEWLGNMVGAEGFFPDLSVVRELCPISMADASQQFQYAFEQERVTHL